MITLNRKNKIVLAAICRSNRIGDSYTHCKRPNRCKQRSFKHKNTQRPRQHLPKNRQPNHKVLPSKLDLNASANINQWQSRNLMLQAEH